ncbi:hypothetical protein ACHAW6_008139 [Cyclotella cf. meneghiniana]
MAVIKTCGTAVLGIALLIGCIGKFQPSLFMCLPFPISILLWILTGHNMPPYFSADAWKEDEIDTWMKDGDLVVATGAKAGTNFILYCAHQIRTKGNDVNDDLYPDVSVTTPWPDLIQSRKGSWAEQKERYNTTVLADGRKMNYYWDNPAYPFRIFKSHFAPPELPVRKGKGKKIKYLAMSRNGLDVAASLTNFYSSHTQTFRDLWGGFPPDVSNHAPQGQTHPVINDLLPPGPLSELYFGYNKKWWLYRNDPNVLLLHYADVRKDLKGSVEKIANFVNVQLTSDELAVVTERCGIEHMKKVNRFNYLMPLNKDKGLWDPNKDTIVKDNELVNKGLIGTGKALFNDQIVKRWMKVEEEEFGHDPELLRWLREGSVLPPN